MVGPTVAFRSDDSQIATEPRTIDHSKASVTFDDLCRHASSRRPLELDATDDRCAGNRHPLRCHFGLCYASDKVSFLKQNIGGGSTSKTTQIVIRGKEPIPAFDKSLELNGSKLRRMLHQAVRSWLGKTPSKLTRVNYQRDIHHFFAFANIPADDWEQLLAVRPEHVAAWRDSLRERGLANATIRRKMTVLRSLYSYLQTYGYVGANPAHGKFVKAPAVPRDGKTVGLSPADCRRLMETPDMNTPAGVRDRAMLGVLAYSACRVGELVTLQVKDLRTSGEHRVLSVFGKGGKERTVPLHVEAVERLIQWIEVAGIADDRSGPLFRPAASPRGQGRDGFIRSSLTTRSVEHMVKRYARQIGLDVAVTVHSLRVTALTTARERGADIIDLQDFAGHADPRTTLTYIRSRDRLSKSPAYVLNY